MRQAMTPMTPMTPLSWIRGCCTKFVQIAVVAITIVSFNDTIVITTTAICTSVRRMCRMQWCGNAFLGDQVACEAILSTMGKLYVLFACFQSSVFPVHVRNLPYTRPRAQQTRKTCEHESYPTTIFHKNMSSCVDGPCAWEERLEGW